MESSDSIVGDVCDQCQGVATIFCKECMNSYCSNCSRVRHRAGKRKEHIISRLSVLPKVTHNSQGITAGKGRGTVIY